VEIMSSPGGDNVLSWWRYCPLQVEIISSCQVEIMSFSGVDNVIASWK